MADLELLEEILIEAGESVLRVHFTAGDIWDLSRFTVAQDMDEDSPHGTAMVIHHVDVPEDTRRLIKEGSGLFFMLKNIVKVTYTGTNKIIFGDAAV